MQVIGLCRFSYPTVGGYKTAHTTTAKQCDFLYHPTRMEMRFRHFETLCLLALVAQTDPEFLFVIVIGDSLPDRYKMRLRELTAGLPQVVIVEHPPGPHRKVMQAVLNRFQDTTRPCLQFRHDDDDVIAVDYVQLLGETAADCTAYLTRHRPLTIDFNHGFTVQTDAKGLLASHRFSPFLGVALAMAVMPEVRQTVMNFQHDKMASLMPTVTRSDPSMFVRSYGAFNDSVKGGDVKDPRHAPSGFFG